MSLGNEEASKGTHVQGHNVKRKATNTHTHTHTHNHMCAHCAWAPGRREHAHTHTYSRAHGTLTAHRNSRILYINPWGGHLRDFRDHSASLHKSARCLAISRKARRLRWKLLANLSR